MEKAGHDNPGLELDTPPGQKDNAAQDDYADQQSDKPSSKNGDPKELTKKEEDVIEVGGDDDDDTFEDLEFDPGSFMAKVDRVHSFLWDSYEK